MRGGMCMTQGNIQRYEKNICTHPKTIMMHFDACFLEGREWIQNHYPENVPYQYLLCCTGFPARSLSIEKQECKGKAAFVEACMGRRRTHSVVYCGTKSWQVGVCKRRIPFPLRAEKYLYYGIQLWIERGPEYSKWEIDYVLNQVPNLNHPTFVAYDRWLIRKGSWRFKIAFDPEYLLQTGTGSEKWEFMGHLFGWTKFWWR